MKAQPLIPDAALRDAYLVVARRNGCGRDRIVAEAALLDEVRTRLGPDYAHVPPDWIRQRVITCCKNPKATVAIGATRRSRPRGSYGQQATTRPSTWPISIATAGRRSGRRHATG